MFVAASDRENMVFPLRDFHLNVKISNFTYNLVIQVLSCIHAKHSQYIIHSTCLYILNTYGVYMGIKIMSQIEE